MNLKRAAAFLSAAALSSALAGGGGKPPSTIDLLNLYADRLSVYAQSDSYPQQRFVSCLGNDLGKSMKPTGLKLIACGLSQQDGNTIINIQSAGGISLTSGPAIDRSASPIEKGIAELNQAIEVYRMRLYLKQPLPVTCASTGLNGKFCAIRAGGDQLEVQYESQEDVRLFYDGQIIHNLYNQPWPEIK